MGACGMQMVMARRPVDGTAGTGRAIASLCFVALTIAGLLPLGSAAISAYTLLAAFWMLFGLATLPLALPAHTTRLFGTALLIAGVTVTWIGLQMLDLSALGIGNPAWQAVPGPSSPSFLSVAPAETRLALLQACLPLVVFMIGLRLAATDAMAEDNLRRIALASGLVIAATLVAHLVAPDRVLFSPRTAYLGDYTATFVNRNTAATFLGLTAILLAGLLWRDIRDGGLGLLRRSVSSTGSPSPSPRPNARRALGRTLACAILLCLVVTGLMLTRSRGGIAATAIGFAILATLLSAAGEKRHAPPSLRRRPARGIVLRAGLAIAIVASVFAMVSGRAALRLETEGVTEMRLCLAPALVRASSANWTTGTGFGTFTQAFPAYRPPQCGLDGILDRAHSLYLEGLIDLGVMFAPLLAVVVATLIATFVTGWRDRRRARHYPAMGLAMLGLAAAHSILDFSLQIPCLAALLAAILSQIASISLSRTGRAGPAIHTT